MYSHFCPPALNSRNISQPKYKVMNRENADERKYSGLKNMSSPHCAGLKPELSTHSVSNRGK